jgi:hypothetical protein
MINYLQTISVFGLPNGLQRAAMAEQKVQAIQTDNDSTFDVESVRALKELEVSTAMDEDRMEERKHGLRTPQSEEDYLRATKARIIYNHPGSNPMHKTTPYHNLPYPSGGTIDIMA